MMEKRLLLAFILSFGFIYFWNALVPKKVQAPTKNTQSFDIKRVAKQAEPEVQPPSAVPLKIINEEKTSIENDKIKVELTNRGGSIHSLIVKEYNYSLPVTDFLSLENVSEEAFSLKEKEESKAVFSLKQNDFEITRTYLLSPGEFLVRTETEISGEMSKQKLIIGAFTLDISRLDNNATKTQDRNLYEYSISTDQVYRKANAFEFKNKEAMSGNKSVEWFGFRDRYFCTLVKPLFPTENFEVEPLNSKQLRISFKPLLGGEKIKLSSIIFYGPQKYNLLQSYNVDLEKIMKFSNLSLLDAVAKTIYNIMKAIHTIIPNWGICIILISLLIYGIMYPLTIKSMSSMKKMQSLQPRINQLREQYKNNPQKLNKEIMDLYKEYKINPLGGCLPLILQMPIFLGLYQVLWRSVEFKGAHFLWIKDLSEPDRLFILPSSLPFIGNEINILPILMIFVMAFQQKLTAKSTVIADPNQAAQQKIMMTIFPVFLGFIFYKFASGLTLYFTIFYLLSTFTQWKISKMTKVA